MGYKYNFKIGHRFGSLTLLELTCVYRKYHKSNWPSKFLCDCGRTYFNTFSHIVKRNVTNCGCVDVANNKKLLKGQAAKNQLIAQYKCGAERRNLKWELTYEQFIHLATSNCFYCNKEPSSVFPSNAHVIRFNGTILYNGVDRIDNSKGYNVLNCVPCCGTCNKAKMCDSISEYLDRIKRTYENLGLQNLDTLTT